MSAIRRASSPPCLTAQGPAERAPDSRHPDQPAAPPRPGRRSRATIAAELQAEFDGARVFQLFARKLDPNDVTYVSALALDPRNRVVEVKATALELGDALVRRVAPAAHAGLRTAAPGAAAIRQGRGPYHRQNLTIG
jgi:hypothetical protein